MSRSRFSHGEEEEEREHWLGMATANDDCTATATNTEAELIHTLEKTPRTRPTSTGSLFFPKQRKKLSRGHGKQNSPLIVNCTNTRYPVVRDVFRSLGYIEEIDDGTDSGAYIVQGVRSSHSQCNVLWTDSVTSLARLTRLEPWQYYNHFPMMHVIARKVHLCVTLGRMSRSFAPYYRFFPKTWSLRSDRVAFKKAVGTVSVLESSTASVQDPDGQHRHVERRACSLSQSRVSEAARKSSKKKRHKEPKTYILKPNAGCQGRGIIITQDPLSALDSLDDYIAQEYITRPLLIEGKKFDMRIYVLVTSVKDLSVFVFHEGLIRMCVEDYQPPTPSNLSVLQMHLTNTAVNVQSEKYVKNQEVNQVDMGSKRNFSFLRSWLESNGHDPEVLWHRIDNIICKTLVAAQPELAHQYRSIFPSDSEGNSCFELLGFDILIDSKLKPWLMEVNHAPSLSADSPLDLSIKQSALREVLEIVGARGRDRKMYLRKEKRAFRERMVRAYENHVVLNGGIPLHTRQYSASSGAQTPCQREPFRGKEDRLSVVQGHQHASSMRVDDDDEEEEEEMVVLIQEEKGADTNDSAAVVPLTAHMKREDSRLRGFRRIFPPVKDRKRWELYCAFLAAAVEARAAPGTVSSQKYAQARALHAANSSQDASPAPLPRHRGAPLVPRKGRRNAPQKNMDDWRRIYKKIPSGCGSFSGTPSSSLTRRHTTGPALVGRNFLPESHRSNLQRPAPPFTESMRSDGLWRRSTNPGGSDPGDRLSPSPKCYASEERVKTHCSEHEEEESVLDEETAEDDEVGRIPVAALCEDMKKMLSRKNPWEEPTTKTSGGRSPRCRRSHSYAVKTLYEAIYKRGHVNFVERMRQLTTRTHHEE